MSERADSRHHLMRVRIRKNVFERLQEVAEEQSCVTGENVTVSDLVRMACLNYLHVYEQLERLQSMPQLLAEMPERFAEGDVLIVPLPGLTLR